MGVPNIPRMGAITLGLVITATTRNCAPQRGRWLMSMSNSRGRWAHESGYTRCSFVEAVMPRARRLAKSGIVVLPPAGVSVAFARSFTID